MFNAPWPALAMAGVIVASYGLQTFSGAEAVIVPRFAFEPASFAAGRWDTLLTALFLHSSWTHALMNGVFALAFGTPVARLFGTGGRGASVFLLFYLLCGALSSLGYALVHPGSTALLVGASGAVSGLTGACARLMAGRGVPGPYFSGPVIGMTAAWVIVNLIIAVVGFAPGAGDTPVAWEAHLFGFAAGLVLIDPFTWLARGPRKS
jgi:membrane associated rhomboid family serine protease